MTVKTLLSALVTAFYLSSLWTASATVIISPGDSSGTGSLNNGGFESATATPWVRNTTNTNIVITTDAANAYQGSKYLTVEKLFVSPYWTNAAQNTGYTILSNDKFEFSFYAKAINGTAVNNTIAWTLFYTSDNTLTGTRTTIAQGASVALTTSYQLTSYTMTSGVDSGAVGKNLFVLIASDSLSNNAVAAVDNVYLASVPEPATSTLALVSLAVLGFSSIKRRSKA